MEMIAPGVWVKSGRKPVEECLEEEKERKRVEALARYW
jgi:hypothetical protein